MPKVVTNYANTVMYKIVCNDLQIKDCYVGHTTNFTKRKNQHKNNSKNGNQLKIYKIIRENGGWDNWTILEIEKYSCNDGNEARSRERYWYEQLQCGLNTQCPNRSNVQYSRDYYHAHVEECSFKRKERYIKNKEKENIKHQEYLLKNRENVLKKAREYQKEYCLKNKEKIREKNSKLIVCECGIEIRNDRLKKHKMTKKHQLIMDTKRN